MARKSYACAASRPVDWTRAASGLAITRVITSIMYGSHFALNVTMK